MVLVLYMNFTELDSFFTRLLYWGAYFLLKKQQQLSIPIFKCTATDSVYPAIEYKSQFSTLPPKRDTNQHKHTHTKMLSLRENYQTHWK